MKIKLSEFDLTKSQVARIHRLRKKIDKIYEKCGAKGINEELTEEKRNGYIGACMSCEFQIIRTLNQKNKQMLKNLVVNNILFDE